MRTCIVCGGRIHVPEGVHPMSMMSHEHCKQVALRKWDDAPRKGRESLFAKSQSFRASVYSKELDKMRDKFRPIIDRWAEQFCKHWKM